jgi:hypothetical protein
MENNKLLPEEIDVLVAHRRRLEQAIASYGLAQYNKKLMLEQATKELESMERDIEASKTELEQFITTIQKKYNIATDETVSIDLQAGTIDSNGSDNKPEN